MDHGNWADPKWPHNLTENEPTVSPKKEAGSFHKHKEQAKDVRANRQGKYGSPAILQRQLAAQWSAILRSHYQDDHFPEIPARLVGIMLGCLKMHRIAVDVEKSDRDSYVDIHNYIDFSEEIDDTLPPKED